MKRASGVLLHLTSLWGDYGSGSLGKAAFEWIDFLAESGFSYWQVLPVCLPDRESHSPYKSPAAFACNERLIDLDDLYQSGLLTKDDLESAKQASPYACEFDRDRLSLLTLASSRADKKTRDEVLSFCESHPEIDAACRFLAKTDEDLFARRFIETTFYRQWEEMHRYAAKKGVKLIGDIPFYVAPDSADVAAHPEQFQLDKDGRLSAVAGVPPDYFAPKGQLWGNPLYDFDEMKRDGFTWWRARLRAMFDLFDGVRIDHFRAVESYYRLPADAEDAIHGEWVAGPREDFVQMLKEEAGDKLIIAEDLGDITKEVAELVKRSGFPGMRVFQFGFDSPHSIHRIHNYPANCVCYSGTHDNNTLLGFLFELDERTRAEALAYVGARGIDDGCVRIVAALLGSHADLCVLPVQDLLRYGVDTRMNVPGRAEGNWGYRVTKEQVNSLDRGYYRALNEQYGRL